MEKTYICNKDYSKCNHLKGIIMYGIRYFG